MSGSSRISSAIQHYLVPAGYQKMLSGESLVIISVTPLTCTYEEEEKDKRLFQCGSQEAGLVKYDKHT